MQIFGLMAAGFAAGCVTGLFGGGGGMVLVPLLSLTALGDDSVFPSSIAVILPVCITALVLSREIQIGEALPWLPGSLIGGILAGKYGQKIPVKWLHRGLGMLILWGGVQYLC